MKQQIKRCLRFLVGRDFYPRWDLQCPRQRLGSPSAGWTFNPSLLDASSIVYCVGIGEDISFDLALMQQFGMEIHAFDPTPKSLNWVRQQTLPATYHVHEWGLAAEDGSVYFAAPDNPEFVSHRMVAAPSDPAALIRAPVQRLTTICQRLNHSRVDLLKMDIEGAEYSVIEDLRNSAVRPRQVLVEFHHRHVDIGLGRTKQAVATMKQLGYGLFHVSPNGEEFAFQLRADA